MTILDLRWSSSALVLGLLTIAPTGCAVDGVGYGGGGGYGYGADYYEPYGGYGGWGDGYFVGPYRNGGYRGGDRGGDHGGDRGGSHAFRSAPASHGMPSIPSGARGGGGGGRGGGGGGGGGHGGGGGGGHR